MRKNYFIHLVRNYASYEQRSNAGILYKNMLSILKKELGLVVVKFHLDWQDPQEFNNLKGLLEKFEAQITNIQKGYGNGKKEFLSGDCKIGFENYVKFRESYDEFTFYGTPEGDYYEDPEFFNIHNELIVENITHEYMLSLYLKDEEKKKLENKLNIKLELVKSE